MSRIISIGLNLVDIYTEDQLMYPGGNELNVSVYASRLGAESAFLGVFGTDATVPAIQNVLRKEHVDFSRCRVEKGENGNSYVKVIQGERVFTGHNNGGVTGSRPVQLNTEDLHYIRGFDVVTSSLYGRVPLTELEKLPETGVPFAYDFSSLKDFSAMRNILPLLEFGFFSCADLSQEQTADFLREARQFGCMICIGTRGEDGALLFDGEKFYRQKAVPVDAVDTMGAGDAFLASFLVSYYDVKTEGSKEVRIVRSLSAAAEFSAQICTQNGAIGYAFPIPSDYSLTERR